MAELLHVKFVPIEEILDGISSQKQFRLLMLPIIHWVILVYYVLICERWSRLYINHFEGV